MGEMCYESDCHAIADYDLFTTNAKRATISKIEALAMEAPEPHGV